MMALRGVLKRIREGKGEDIPGGPSIGFTGSKTNYDTLLIRSGYCVPPVPKSFIIDVLDKDD